MPNEAPNATATIEDDASDLLLDDTETPEETTDDTAPTEAKAPDDGAEEQPGAGEDEKRPAKESKDEPKGESKDESRGHDLDRGLIQLQQRQTTFERTVNENFENLTGSVNKLLEAVQSRGGEPTAKQEQQLDKAEDDLQKFIADIKADENFEVDDAMQKMVAFAERVQKKLHTGKPLDESEIEKRVEQIIAKREKDHQQRQSKIAAAEQEFAQKFKADNPDLSGQYAEMVREAQREVAQAQPATDGEAQKLMNVLWPRIVRERQQALEKASPEPKKPAKKGKGDDEPPQSTKGTQTVAPGASPKPAKSQFLDEDEEIPLMDEDELG